jgi:uncharacterized protein
MRTSSYTIYVDLPDSPDEQLLVHGYSGAYDVVERRVADYLRSHEDDRHTPLHGEWPQESQRVTPRVPVHLPDETIEMLRRRGFLTTRSAIEERELVKKAATRRHAVERENRPTYILMPTYQCNLRCGYCFQDHMRTNPAFSHLLKTMSKDMAKRIVRAMDKIDALHPNAAGKPRRITLFGGEPLLAENRPFIEWWINELKAAGPCEIAAVSNATQLEAYADLLGPTNIDHVQITIDGPADIHDQRRIHADGSGSFEMIAKNTTMALERGINIAMRVNVDKSNLTRLPELARAIIERGWDKNPNFMAYAAAVHASNEQTDKKDTYNGYALSLRMLELREKYPELRAIARPSDELRNMVFQILRGHAQPWEMYKSAFCGAHSTMYVFDAFGDIYACWERTGDPSIRIGTIAEDGTPHLQRRRDPSAPAAEPAPVKRLLPVLGKPIVNDVDTWRERTFATNDTCASCRYAFYCGGGCAAEAMDHRGEFHTNYCNGFQQRFRVAAADAYSDVKQGRVGAFAQTVGCAS